MEFELVWFANTHGRHAIWWMKPTWSHVKFGPRSWKMIHESSEKKKKHTPRKSVVFDHDLQFFTNFTVVHPLGRWVCLLFDVKSLGVFFDFKVGEVDLHRHENPPSKEHLQFELELVWDIFRHPEDVVMMLGPVHVFFSRVRRNLLFPELAMRSA